jgi:hypothetical protein
MYILETCAHRFSGRRRTSAFKRRPGVWFASLPASCHRETQPTVGQQLDPAPATTLQKNNIKFSRLRHNLSWRPATNSPAFRVHRPLWLSCRPRPLSTPTAVQRGHTERSRSADLPQQPGRLNRPPSEKPRVSLRLELRNATPYTGPACSPSGLEICRMRCSSSRRRAAAQAHRSNGDSAPTSSLSALVPRGSAILAAMPHGEPHGPAVAASAAPTWVETEVRTDPNRRTPDTLCTPDGMGRSLPRTATPYVVRGFGVAESPHAVHSGAQGTLYARANCPSARPPSGCTPRIQSSATGTRQVRAIGAPRPA